MSKLTITITIIASVISVLSPLFADKSQSDFPKVLESMVAIQNSLSGDSFKTVEHHAKILGKWVHEEKPSDIDHKIASKSLEQLSADDIKTVREGFKKFNLEFAKHLKKHPISSKGYRMAYCPMAKARWIQKDNKIANPYFGKSMLRCGTFKK